MYLTKEQEREIEEAVKMKKRELPPKLKEVIDKKASEIRGRFKPPMQWFHKKVLYYGGYIDFGEFTILTLASEDFPKAVKIIDKEYRKIKKQIPTLGRIKKILGKVI